MRWVLLAARGTLCPAVHRVGQGTCRSSTVLPRACGTTRPPTQRRECAGLQALVCSVRMCHHTARRRDNNNNDDDNSSAAMEKDASATTADDGDNALANAHPFFDDSLGEEHDHTGEETTSSPHSRSHMSPSARRRANFSRQQSMSAEHNRAAQQRLLAVMDQAQMEDPMALEYSLHTYKEIPASVYRSVRAHNLLFEYVSRQEDILMRRHFIDRVDVYKAEFMGKALYIRIAPVRDTRQTSSGSNGSSDAPPAAPTITSTIRDGVWGAGRNAPRGKARWESDVERALFAGVARIVPDYARHGLEPLPGEIAFDVSSYAATAPYVAAAKVNVEQFSADVASILGSETIEKKGLAGTRTASAKLAPLSPEDVAREIAGRITREVVKPLAAAEAAASGGGAHRRVGDYCVCIGIAQTPVLAKIACDAEVLNARLQSRHDASPAADDPTQSSSSSTTSRRTPPIVRVRSFYGHIRTLRDSKRFMASFRVAHVPVFTPAFVAFLRTAFGIDTCAQLYERREELYFNLSKATFDACYDAAFGRMRFPLEARCPLFCPENVKHTNAMLKPLATNIIAIANADRTGIRRGFSSVDGSTIRSRNLMPIDSRLNYGRLFTDGQFVDLCMQAMLKAVERMHRKGTIASGLRLDVRLGLVVQHVVTRKFPATNDYAEMMAVGRSAAEELCPHRQGKGTEERGAYYCVCLTLTGLELAVMVPQRLEEEIVAVKEAYLKARKDISRIYGRPAWRRLVGERDASAEADSLGESVEEEEEEEEEEEAVVDDYDDDEDDEAVVTAAARKRPTQKKARAKKSRSVSKSKKKKRTSRARTKKAPAKEDDDELVILVV